MLRRGHEFLKRFRNHLAQAVAVEPPTLTVRTSHEIKPSERPQQSHGIRV
jgi:hypothetical protein